MVSLHSAEHIVLTSGRLYDRGVSDVTGAALDVTGGDLDILDTLTLTGTTNWSGGTIDGYGQISTDFGSGITISNNFINEHSHMDPH